MARMIPPELYPECASPGEREIFRRLQNSPDTRGWIVLHSLEIAHHRRKVAGEADFVVIVPGKGILCVEVKACSRLLRKDGNWYYGADPKADPRGPFKQASEAMHSIRRRIIGQCPDLSRVLFWSAVVLPYVAFDQSSGEWHAWQVVDAATLRSRSIASALGEVLDNARGYTKSKLGATWFAPDSAEPSVDQCDAIANLLRPDFEFFESPADVISRNAGELRKYTAEQMGALDAMAQNPRTVFAGPAGTGKTLLAIEAAKRARASGKRVLLVCFNRLLGRWLEEQTSTLKPAVSASTLHKHMLSTAGGASPSSSSESYWNSELPSKAIEALLQKEGNADVFDELIVDEAQDVLRSTYLDYLDLNLAGGLSSGRWRMFGDFEKQAIYGAPEVDLDLFVGTRGGHAPIYSLRANCRNTPRIASLTLMLGGLSPDYSRVLRPDNHVEPELKYFRDSGDQRALLTQVVRKLIDEGCPEKDIVILSRRSDEACAASYLDPAAVGRKVKPFGAWGGEGVRYSSIHAFKGLESPVIVVTDIDQVSDEMSAPLFYVAVTRALHRLVILLNVNAREEVLRILTTPRRAGDDSRG